MMLGRICTICGNRLEEDDLTECGTCGRRIHAQCETYETSFECSRCSDEQWIGTVEF